MVPLPNGGILGALDFADGFEELLRRTRLGQKSERGKGDRLFHEVAFGETGVNDNGKSAPMLPDLRNKKFRHSCRSLPSSDKPRKRPADLRAARVE